MPGPLQNLEDWHFTVTSFSLASKIWAASFSFVEPEERFIMSQTQTQDCFHVEMRDFSAEACKARHQKLVPEESLWH